MFHDIREKVLPSRLIFDCCSKAVIVLSGLRICNEDIRIFGVIAAIVIALAITPSLAALQQASAQTTSATGTMFAAKGSIARFALPANATGASPPAGITGSIIGGNSHYLFPMAM
jgi:hypothetical protein